MCLIVSLLDWLQAGLILCIFVRALLILVRFCQFIISRNTYLMGIINVLCIFVFVGIGVATTASPVVDAPPHTRRRVPTASLFADDQESSSLNDLHMPRAKTPPATVRNPAIVFQSPTDISKYPASAPSSANKNPKK